MSALSILAEECELLNDSKYRSYITQVEKALRNFDSTSEWADLISALGKLNKVLLYNVKYPVIPKRVTIGKRLAQCLHPALPGGVHLKALETYDIIFKCIGTQRLAQDLFIYSAGLFPLLGHSAMNVKPILLMIYERHFVSLGKRIKPGLNGLLLGLLPGLEEGSEFYDQTNGLLEDFCESTEPAYFYTCLWECVFSCPSVRLPAVTFLLTHYKRKQTMEDQLYMIGMNINLMVDAIGNAVQDTSVLVQRSLLDFLMIAFPLHNSQLIHSDMAKIVRASITVLLRRDMSLNRRLYAWLMGTSVTSVPVSTRPVGDISGDTPDVELSYFQKFSKELLVQALKSKLLETSDSSLSSNTKTVLKPFRILISLLDKPEIGPVILENVLLSIFRCLYREFEASKSASSDTSSKANKVVDKISLYDELLKTANVLFGTFEPYFIWEYTGRIFEQSCQQTGHAAARKPLSRQGSSAASRPASSLELPETATIGELCQLVSFLLDIVSLETFSETQTEHLPTLLCHVISSLTNHCARLTDTDIIVTLQLCTKILSKVQPTMTISGSHDQSADKSCDGVAVVEASAPVSVVAHDKDTFVMDMKEALELNKKLKAESESNEQGNQHDREPFLTGTSEQSECQTAPASEINQSTNESQAAASQSDTLHSISYPANWEPEKSTNLVQNCIDCFQNFFHTLVTRKLLHDQKVAQTCFDSLLLSSDKVHGFEKDSCLDSGSECSYDCTFSQSGECVDESMISAAGIEETSIKTFTCACQLLVEFASFPIYATGAGDTSRASSAGTGYLPLWVEKLLVCCCFMDSFAVQSAAISTMLDLIILTQSVQADGSSSGTSGDNDAQSGARVATILSTLHPEYLQYLCSQTRFHKVAASVLWGYMGEAYSLRHQQAVKLFNILHQVAPSSWVCENVIGNGLVSELESMRIESFKKFTVLWHLTRTRKDIVIPGKPLRTYDRSMFVVLDSLKDESSPVKIVASTWLSHVIQHGDISRVMEPLLLMLLHPDTARVSVQHVNIGKARTVRLSESSDNDPEANIYAISSEGGNVIYHVSDTRAATRKHSREELKSYALTVLSDRGIVTAPSRSRSQQELHFERVNPNDVSLRINPFGSESSLDKLIFDGYDFPPSQQQHILNKAKRLDRETCAKEGISFINGGSGELEQYDDEQAVQSTPNDSNKEETTEVIVQSVLDEIMNSVVYGKPTDARGENPPSGLPLSSAQKTRPTRLQQRSASVNSSNAGDADLLNSVNKQGAGIDSPTISEIDLSVFKEEAKDVSNIHTLHMHLLLYTQKYDYERTLYALSTLKSMLATCPKLMVTALVTTSVSALRTPQLAKLQLLLARHRKSVFGKNFFGEIPPDVMSNYRSSMFIEILISVCLYFIRAYYPNLMMSQLSVQELQGNKEVHILAMETLTLLMSEIINIMRQSGKNFVSYIGDLLQRSKLQKALLHCVLASIYNNRRKKESDIDSKVTEAIIAFNEEHIVPSANETFQIKLLNLLLVMIILEERIHRIKGNIDTPSQQEWDRLKVSYQPSLHNVRYNVGHPIVQQGMFLSSVLSALKQTHLCHMHRHWVALVTAALPYMDKHLPGIVISVVSQVCRNLEALAVEYEAEGHASTVSMEKIPPDHLVTMLDGLMTLCHYCLLDHVSPVSVGHPTPSSAVSTPDSVPTTNILTSLFHVFNPIGGHKDNNPQRDTNAVSPVLDARNQLLSVLPRIIACMASLWRAVKVMETRDESPSFAMGTPKVLCQYILEFVSPISLPHGTHLLGAIAVAWNDRRKKTTVTKNHKKVMPAPCEDQLLLVDLVSAIKVLPMDTLVQTVKQVLKQPPPSELGRGKKTTIPLEVNMLQFFYSYVERMSPSQLVDAWPSLLTLLRESLQLGLLAPGQFLLLMILNEFVHKTPSGVDKKNQKEIQEMSQRLLEVVAAIAGSSLEQTAWLRKNYAVKPGPQSDVSEQDNSLTTEDETSLMEEKMSERRVVEPEPTIVVTDSKYSVQALTLLAELTAPLLDVIYSSEEKERVVPFLITLLYNVFPYLKNHSSNNLPSLRASSQIMASISSYQYSRKAWRKETLELLLEPSFFQMDSQCIGYWRTVVDNLMTHDKTTYKDLMARVTMAQAGSLNLFSNKEQEIDQKAAMLKRLAFTVFCSEPDQYQKSIPEIQEKLAESLRLPQAPSVMAQVFLCFRVLMLRISPQHLTSMWPTIITELIHVFLQIEQELSTETEEFMTQVQRIAALDSSWAHLGNGLNAHNNPSWLQLYLSACKLLDLCLSLPADKVPQFQLYRWAFIGGAAAGEVEDSTDEEDNDTTDHKGGKNRKRKHKAKQPSFKPHIIRLSRLFNTKLHGDLPVMKMTPGRPLLTISYLRSLAELQPFFNTLCLANQTDNILMAARQLGANAPGNQPTKLANGLPASKPPRPPEGRQSSVTGRGMSKSQSVPSLDMLSPPQVDLGLQNKTNRQFIEDILEWDFLEPMP